MKSRNLFFYVLIFISICSFTKRTDPNFRIIVDDHFTHEFYISSKKIKKQSNKKEYYWFRSGAIHNSYGGADGKLLNGKYTKKYTNNQLAESGSFAKGLKIKTWKTWHQNGQLKNTIDWQKGKKSGLYQSFNEKGELELKGHYTNNKKAGRWISYTSKDTTYYREGKIITKKENDNQPSKFKTLINKVFKKKQKTTKKKKPVKKKSTTKKNTNKQKNKNSNVKS